MSQQINLLNPLFLKPKRYFSAHMMGVALSLLAAGLAALWGFAYWNLSYLRTEAARASALVASETQRLTELRATIEARSRFPELQAEIRRAEVELAKAQHLATLIEQELTRGSRGVSRYLTALARQHRDGLWLTEGAFADGAIVLKGRMVRRDELPAYLERLGHEEPFRGLTFAQVEIAAGKEEAADNKKRDQRTYLEFLLRTKER